MMIRGVFSPYPPRHMRSLGILLVAAFVSAEGDCPEAFSKFLTTYLGTLTVPTGQQLRREDVVSHFSSHTKNEFSETSAWSHFSLACKIASTGIVSSGRETRENIPDINIDSLTREQAQSIIQSIVRAASLGVKSDDKAGIAYTNLAHIAEGVVQFMPQLLRDKTGVAEPSQVFGSDGNCPRRPPGPYQYSLPANVEGPIGLYSFLRLARQCNAEGKPVNKVPDGAIQPTTHTDAAVAAEGVAHAMAEFAERTRQVETAIQELSIRGVNMAAHVHVLNTYIDLLQRTSGHLLAIADAEKTVSEQLKLVITSLEDITKNN